MKKLELDYSQMYQRDSQPLKIDGEVTECDRIDVQVKDVKVNYASAITEQRIKTLRIEGRIMSLGLTTPRYVILELENLHDSGETSVKLDNEPLQEGAYIHGIETKLTGIDNEVSVRFMARSQQDTDKPSAVLYGTCTILVDKMTMDFLDE